jgi:flagellar M-ring protein FliF
MEMFEQIKVIWNRLPGQQRIFMIFVVIALMVIITVAGIWAGRTEYGVMYSNLSSEDAGAIASELQSKGMDYKLGNNGTTILVPKSEIYENRISLATTGLPNAGGQGYELLDSNKMGWTDFVQKIQSRRALEGEISRTIASLREVNHARVHLVIPEPTLYQNDEKAVTASVVVSLKSGTKLQASHVQGIVHLMAASVEGLESDNITLLDTSGRLLSKPSDGGMLSASSDQLGLITTVENSYCQKVQTALERVLGQNKAVVRVAVDLDFQKSETTSETYDSEAPALRSEQRTESSGGDAGTSEESTANYELSKTISHVINNPGTVKRISASIFVDGSYNENEDGTREYIPRSDSELLQLSNLVKAAIGFDDSRGDLLSIENLAFDTTQMEQNKLEMQKIQQMEMIEKMGGLAVSLILAAGALFILWRLVKRLSAGGGDMGTTKSRAGLPGGGSIDLEEEDSLPTSTDIKQMRLQKKLDDISKQSPDEISRIISAWMREGA